MIITSSFCLRSCFNINDDDDDETFQLIITVHASSSTLTVSACALGAGCFHCLSREWDCIFCF